MNYDSTGAFSEGLAYVRDPDNSIWGFIDETGSIALNLKEIKVDRTYMKCTEGLVGVLLKDKWGFLDKNGNFVIQPTYEDVYPFTEEGLARAKTDGKWGFIDTKGNVVIDFIYDYVYDFSDETALVRDGDTFFYINTEGKKINDLIITRRN